METLPLYTEARALSASSVTAQGHRELQHQEVTALLMLAERHGVTDEAVELIEMRYQQALALMNLEELFAEAQLDCM